MMIQQELARRVNRPLLQMEDGSACTAELWPKRRQELLNILEQNIYGITPKGPSRVTATLLEEKPKRVCAGKVLSQTIDIAVDAPFGSFSFPIEFMRPRSVTPAPVFVLLNFRPDLPDEYMPIEEITDQGYAIARIFYKDVVNDNLHGDYSDGMAKAYFNGRAREPHEWGKIGMWAYAASRTLDYLLTRPDVDGKRVAVIGHSRLGKTALWTAAQDERFYASCPNCSGMCGGSLTRFEDDPMYDKLGEPIARFLRSGSWDWYCERFKDALGKESQRPFDQHFLMALVAPRYVCAGSAQNDHGMDPQSEYLCCHEVDKVYRLLGYEGFVAPLDRFSQVGDHFTQGNVSHHLRPGEHFLSREDWNHYIKFLNLKQSSPT